MAEQVSFTLTEGQKVGAGRFTLIRVLGRGGMGVVWLARDSRFNDEEVALKFLPPEVAADPSALHDLRRETRKSRTLTHANILRIHDFFEAPDEPAFISMEYVDGPNLAALRVQQPQACFSWEFLRPMMIQLCQALEYAHSENVVHRDLKPANLMVDAKGRLKLSDFGIAATISDSSSRISLRHSGSGTVIYMSPQQMRGEKPRPSDDVYALGATLYELLASKPPFYQGGAVVVMNQVLNEPAPSLMNRLAEEGISEIPEPVANTIMACLAKDPAQRPDSARAVLEQLLNAAPVISESETEKSPEIFAPEKRGGRSLKLVGGIIAITMCLGLTGLGYWMKHSAKTQSANPPEKIKADDTNASEHPTEYPLGESEIVFRLLPIEAELLTNGVPVVSAEFPFSLKGLAGRTIQIEVRAPGYVSQKKSISFPNGDHYALETITLQPDKKSMAKFARWTNSLGQIFMPVPGTTVLFSIWDTRVQDFAAFVKATGYDATAGMLTIGKDGWKFRGDDWRTPGFTQGPTHPVCGVNWDDTQAYCKWLTAKERDKGSIRAGQSYRLPTDAEWSVAVGNTIYPWGNAWPPKPGLVNYAGSEVLAGNWPPNYAVISGYRDAFPRTSPVGSFSPNDFGLYDMGGNVWQWCEDWYRKEMNTQEALQLFPWANNDGGGRQFRLIRGGSWKNGSSLTEVESAFRHKEAPTIRRDNNGFRCVLTVGQ